MEAIEHAILWPCRENFPFKYHLLATMSFTQKIRGLITLCLAPLLTFVVSVCALVDMLLIRRSEWKAQWFPRIWGRGICLMAGVKVIVEGLEQIDPKGTYIFAANHASQFDIFAFQGYFPHDFRWIAKKELFKLPVFGRAMQKVGYIPIDRSHGRQAVKSLDDAAKQIAAGKSVLIFPEGTRSPNGHLQDFKAGAILLAIKSGVPIVPLGFNGSYEILPRGSFLAKNGIITLRLGPPLPTAHFKAKDKEYLLQQLRNEVAKLLEAQYQPEEKALCETTIEQEG